MYIFFQRNSQGGKLFSSTWDILEESTKVVGCYAEKKRKEKKIPKKKGVGNASSSKCAEKHLNTISVGKKGC